MRISLRLAQLVCGLGLSCLIPAAGSASTNVHTSWLWHVHQPVYWPDRRVSGPDHAEAAWDTIQQQDAGRLHPAPENLRSIFGLDDRVAAYQGRPRDALNGLRGYANAGAQMSYSGALMENAQSLGVAGQLGYGSSWLQGNREARAWTTSGGKPRLDLLNFTYHHALAPLLSDETLEMELRIHQRQMEIFWGTTPPVSRGYFPTETCFTKRMIPVLNKLGIAWTMVANSHLTRACADFPVVTGSGGENCDLPNRADQLNPAQGVANYRRLSIERGCSPSAAMPFAFQTHYARYVDPATGVASRIVLVPNDQPTGWRDSYGNWDLHLLDDLAARNSPSRPALALFGHDGDNGWSGGYSYYMQWVASLASTASAMGFEPTTVEQFLAEFPPDTNDVVHIEDGGWVFADGDFGSPIFVNWHWPPSYSASGANVVDPSRGVSDKADNWRVIIATENSVKTAQQISGAAPRVDQVRDPWSFGQTPGAVELAWHYYLAGLDSGFVYYGCHDDECQRSVVAQSNALRNASALLTNGAPDLTGPTMFPPQRHPWNPGGTNFGVQYSYKLTIATNSDFWVWTYAYDVSGITNATLFFRMNGTNPPIADQFQTYAGGPLAGPWIASNLTRRVVVPVIGVTPTRIADYYFAQVRGVANAFVDYYIAATDAAGNITRSPIQHVWVGVNGSSGGGGGSTPGCNGRVCVSPAAPVAGAAVKISYDPTGSALGGAASVKIHLGWNNWTTVANPDPAMTFNATSNRWEITVTAPANADELDCVFNNGSGTWDNNSGADWRFPVAAGVPQFVMDGAFDSAGYLLASNGMVLHAALRGGMLYVATGSAAGGAANDHFIFVSDALLPAATANAPWAKSGKVAVASTKPFLAAEGANSYVSWFMNGATATFPCAKSATTAGALEGTLDLATVFGSVPPVIYLCAAAYQTADGGGLAAQSFPVSGADLGTNSLLAIPTSALLDSRGNGTFDRLDPARGFRLLSARLVPGGVALDWNAMPGRAYEVLSAASPGGTWAVLPSLTSTAGPLELTLSATNSPAPDGGRFYRVRLRQ